MWDLSLLLNAFCSPNALLDLGERPLENEGEKDRMGVTRK